MSESAADRQPKLLECSGGARVNLRDPSKIPLGPADCLGPVARGGGVRPPVDPDGQWCRARARPRYPRDPGQDRADRALGVQGHRDGRALRCRLGWRRGAGPSEQPGVEARHDRAERGVEDGGRRGTGVRPAVVVPRRSRTKRRARCWTERWPRLIDEEGAALGAAIAAVVDARVS